jgi:phosphohistidine phosphatase
LTKKGRGKFKNIANGLKQLEEHIDLILTSPFLRAMQTTELLAKTFSLDDDRIIQTEHLTPTGSPDKLIDMINENDGDVENIAIVGHEPYLSRLVSMLIAGDPEISLNLKKGGICCLSVEKLIHARCATLNWLLSPAQLVQIGE